MQGVLVGERDPEVDAVPLIDARTASVLGQTGAFTIVQRPSLTETFCPACERSNIYDVYDGTSGQHIFFAKERSECVWRLCCSPNHTLLIEFKPSTVVAPQAIHFIDINTLPTALTMEREGCPMKPGLGCCAWVDCCKDGAALPNSASV